MKCLHHPSTTFVPSFSLSLLSVKQLCTNRCCHTIFTSTCYIFQETKNWREICRGLCVGTLYYVLPYTRESPKVNNSSTPSTAFKWHLRLGHPNANKLKMMVPSLSSVSPFRCESCEFAKHNYASLPSYSRSRSNKLCEVIHSDVWGPLAVPNQSHFRYYKLFIDDYNCMSGLYLMKERTEVFSKFVFYE